MAGLRLPAIAALLHCFGGLAPASAALLRGDASEGPAHLDLKAATKAKERALQGGSQHQKHGGRHHKAKKKLGPLQKAAAELVSATDAMMKASEARVAKVQNETVSTALLSRAKNRSTLALQRVGRTTSASSLLVPPGPSALFRRTRVVAIPDEKDAVLSIVEATDLANAAINAVKDAVEAHVMMSITLADNVSQTILPELRRHHFNTSGKPAHRVEFEITRIRLHELANFTRGNSTELLSNFSMQVTKAQREVTTAVTIAHTFTKRLAQLDLIASADDVDLEPVPNASVKPVLRKIQVAERSVQAFLDMMSTAEEACFRFLDDYVRGRVFHQLQVMGQNCKQTGPALSHPAAAAGCEQLVARRTEVGNSLTKTQKRLEDTFAHAAAMETTVYDSLDALRRVVRAWPGKQ